MWNASISKGTIKNIILQYLISKERIDSEVTKRYLNGIDKKYIKLIFKVLDTQIHMTDNTYIYKIFKGGGM